MQIHVNLWKALRSAGAKKYIYIYLIQHLSSLIGHTVLLSHNIYYNEAITLRTDFGKLLI